MMCTITKTGKRKGGDFLKGYYTYYCYMGWTGKCYRAFETESEYAAWWKENQGG